MQAPIADKPSSTVKISNPPLAPGQEVKGAGRQEADKLVGRQEADIAVRQEATAKVQGPNPVPVLVQPMGISPRGGGQAVSLIADSGKPDKKSKGETVRRGKSLRDLGQDAQKDAKHEQELALRTLPMDIGQSILPRDRQEAVKAASIPTKRLRNHPSKRSEKMKREKENMTIQL